MTAEIVPFTGGLTPASKIGHYLRIGDSGHQQLDSLVAEGRFPYRKVVVDASQYRHQKQLVDTLKASGVETVLDTKAAELAERGKFLGNAKHAPWAMANKGQLLGPDFYHPISKAPGTSKAGVIEHIARFCVENNFDAVLAPAHMLREGANDPWFGVDLLACRMLREKLDGTGGKHVRIDYNLIIQHTLLRDESVRGALISQLADLDFGNLWIRSSGFGAHGTPAGARGYINSLSGFHNLGKPIVADYLGGLIGNASLAFGALSGIAHGIGEKTRFETGDWHKEPKKRDGAQPMGRPKRIHIDGFDHSLTIPELTSLAKARGGHRLLVCQDRKCCPHGLDNMIKDSKSHAVNQQFNSIARLEQIPDTKRAEHFIRTDLELADQKARQIKELKPDISELRPRKGQTAEEAGTKLVARLKTASLRDEKLRAVLENLHEVRGNSSPRAIEIISSENLSLDKLGKHTK